MNIILFDAFIEGYYLKGTLRIRLVIEPHYYRMRAAIVRYYVAFLR
jgi:hypothetical protein